MNTTLLFILFIFLQLVFLFPLKDNRSRRRGFPWMTATLVLLNVLIHVWVTITVYMRPNSSDEPIWLPLYPFMNVSELILKGEGLGALSVLTSTFLHADLNHLVGNMIFLWFFGRKVEDATGPLRFTFFYLLCGFTAGLTCVVVDSIITPATAHIPGLGASGAISGLMGAYFFLYSDERVLTLVSTWLAPLIPLPGGCFIPLPIPLRLPVWVFIVYNLLQDAILGQFVLEFAKQNQTLFLGIGVFAHLGGAAGGLLFIYFFLHPEVFARRR